MMWWVAVLVASGLAAEDPRPVCVLDAGSSHTQLTFYSWLPCDPGRCAAAVVDHAPGAALDDAERFYYDGGIAQVGPGRAVAGSAAVLTNQYSTWPTRLASQRT
jgi:hypothetical protein